MYNGKNEARKNDNQQTIMLELKEIMVFITENKNLKG